MAQFVAFLRGMNLGRRRITNDALCDHFEALGFESPTAFLASGNIVFESDLPRARVASTLESGLRERLDYDVPVFVRSAARTRAIADAKPFDAENTGKLQVAMLRDRPTPAGARTVQGLTSDADWLALQETELYWWPSGGLTESDLDVSALDRAIGPMTVRTRNTVVRLAAKFLVLLLCVLPIVSCSTAVDARQHAEQRARRVAELAKPAFDRLQALPRGAATDDVVAAFDGLPNLESHWKGTKTLSIDESDVEVLMARDLETEPAARYRFDDLDLVVWEFPDGMHGMGVEFPPAWLVLRTLRVNSGRHEEWVCWGMMHTIAIGDLRFGELGP